MTIQEILAKYENFYKGGSGYMFQIEVDDFNALVKHMSEQQEEIETLKKIKKVLMKDIAVRSESINALEFEVEELQSVSYEQKDKNDELEKEIIEHCETKGLSGRQVFTLTKRVDELVEKTSRYENWNAELQAELIEKDEEIERYKKEITELRGKLHLSCPNCHDDCKGWVSDGKPCGDNYYPPRISIKPGKRGTPLTDAKQEVINLLKDETKNLDDNEMLSFNVSFVKDIIELLESKEKKTIATILAYVEKNHDAPEIEEYLWKMLDKGTEFE